MALSKKHYEAIARQINAENSSVEQNPLATPVAASAVHVALRNLTVSLCTEFRRDNPAFDGQRFLKACGF